MKEEMPLEMRRVLMSAFKSVGGQQKFDAWAKRHPTMLYNMLMKLVPSMAQVASSVDVRASVHVTEDQAMQKLMSAYSALVEAERDDDGGRATIDNATYTRIADQPSRAADTSARGTGHAATDATTTSTVDGHDQNKNNSNLENNGSPLARGLRTETKAPARPVSVEPREMNTTEKYLDWANNGGLGAREMGANLEAENFNNGISKMENRIMTFSEKIGDPPQEQPIFIDELVAELAQAIADLTKVVDYLASTKTLPHAEAAANARLHEFLKRIA